MCMPVWLAFDFLYYIWKFYDELDAIMAQIESQKSIFCSTSVSVSNIIPHGQLGLFRKVDLDTHFMHLFEKLANGSKVLYSEMAYP